VILKMRSFFKNCVRKLEDGTSRRFVSVSFEFMVVTGDSR